MSYDVLVSSEKVNNPRKNKQNVNSASSYECLENKSPVFTSDKARLEFENSVKRDSSNRSTIKSKVKSPSELISNAIKRASEKNVGKSSRNIHQNSHKL